MILAGSSVLAYGSAVRLQRLFRLYDIFRTLKISTTFYEMGPHPFLTFSRLNWDGTQFKTLSAILKAKRIKRATGYTAPVRRKSEFDSL